MSANTSIEWTDATVNPIRARNIATGAVGHFCEKVSPGCANCYASTWNERVRPIATKTGGRLIGTGLKFDARNREKVEFFLDEKKLRDVLKRRTPSKFFWCDMTDMFAEWVPFEWIDQCFAVMALTPQHVHQVLTKRADRMREYMDGRAKSANYWKVAARALGYALEFEGISLVPFPLPNVWLGVSVEDQQRADERIPMLLATAAAIRFVSAEPLLATVDLTRLSWGSGDFCDSLRRDTYRGGLDSELLDWVIVGGESGPGARPFDIVWARSIVQQCKAAGVPVFVKQLGARPLAVGPPGDPRTWILDLASRKGGDPSEWPEDLRVREFPTVAA